MYPLHLAGGKMRGNIGRQIQRGDVFQMNTFRSIYLGDEKPVLHWRDPRAAGGRRLLNRRISHQSLGLFGLDSEYFRGLHLQAGGSDGNSQCVPLQKRLFS